MKPREINDLLTYLTPDEQSELDAMLAHDAETVLWRPLPGPQNMAYNSTADVIGFGGSAGGGKTDLACGKGLTQHERVAVFRREGTELTGVIDRLTELIGNKDGYNGKDRIWRLGGRKQFEFCSVPNLGDEKKYQGRPKDLLVLDEASNFLEAQARFLMGWVRSTTPGQPCQTLMCFNPPTSAEGRWIVKFFAPWIDKRFAGPRAAPGELHYVGVVPGENGVSRDIWFGSTNPGPFVIIDGQPVFDFDPTQYEPQEIVTPQSRTFIPSRISDNPYLMGTGYMTVLQSLPEPLRSQMLFGSFEAGMTDDPWQVIPTAWVERAMLRWKDRSPKGLMSSLGVDVARGGADATVLSPRHDNWYDKLLSVPGKETPSGQAVVGQVIAVRRNAAPVHIDVIGVGASPYDLMREANIQVIGVNVAEKSMSTDKSGRLRFANLRSELWWKMREALDPENDLGTELPPDPELLADLCAPMWSLQGLKVQVESREEIVNRIGRSPDKASALILAQLDTPNLAAVKRAQGHTNKAVLDYDPLEDF